MMFVLDSCWLFAPAAADLDEDLVVWEEEEEEEAEEDAFVVVLLSPSSPSTSSSASFSWGNGGKATARRCFLPVLLALVGVVAITAFSLIGVALLLCPSPPVSLKADTLALLLLPAP